MSRKSRIEFLITTLCILISGFVLYGLIGSMVGSLPYSKAEQFLLFGSIGGFGFSIVFSSIVLAVNFFSKRKTLFKIIASVLWPLTFACIIYVGIVLYIPYHIYNLVKIIQSKYSNSGTSQI